MDKHWGIVVGMDRIEPQSLPFASLGNTTFLEHLLGRIDKAYPDLPKIFACGFWDMQHLSARIKALIESRGFRYFIADREYGARLMRTARAHQFAHILEIDALNPLTTIHFIPELMQAHLDRDADITVCHNLPATLTPRAFSARGLSLYNSLANTAMAPSLGMTEILHKPPSPFPALLLNHPDWFRVCFFEAPLRWEGAAFDPFIEEFRALRLETDIHLSALRRVFYTINKDDLTSDDVIDALLIRAMQSNWDQPGLFDTRYAVVDQPDMGTPESYNRAAEKETLEFVLSDAALMAGQDPRTLNILELGCGMGRLLRVLADRFHEVHGTDASPERFLEARFRLKDFSHVFVTQNDGRSLSQCADNRFDLCFAHGVFVHIHSKGIIDNYIRELGRVVKPGGRVKFDLYHGTDLFGIGPRFFGIGARYTEEEITRVLASSGLKLKSMKYIEHVQFERNADPADRLSGMPLKQMLVVAEKPAGA